MKKITCLLLLLLSFSPLFANGVMIRDANKALYLHPDSSIVTVSVRGQISITTTTQYFKNPSASVKYTYAFPLNEQASATQLRWSISGDGWNTASIAGKPQSTTLPGSGTPAAKLTTYLGKTPLYFPFADTLRSGSTIAVELTYVELLPYAFGKVTYTYPGDYRLIDTTALAAQHFSFQLSSPRKIDSITVKSPQYFRAPKNFGDSAYVRADTLNSKAFLNDTLIYSLNASELGLYAYSSRYPDSNLPDTLGGFLTFIAEPNPGDVTSTISKVFTLIVDCSGSMSGTKMTQARDAASYIIQNLNEGDKFNIVKFETNVSSFRPGHVNYTFSARDSALAYISQFAATNNTNISGAFDMAVPQFKIADSSTANIVVFLTDGQPTVGITAIAALASHIDSLIRATESNVNLFSFGIGTDANQQLLTLISSHNSGLAAFLGNDELYSRITAFYNTIQNPVLLNTRIVFNPPIVKEIYPDSLPNLYKGQQMIVAGRYSQSGPVKITLSGNAFGRPVSYSYDLDLAKYSMDGLQFLPKVWAKRKIESLLVHYYAVSSTSAQAKAIQAQIVDLSQTYGVLSSFTSFTATPSPTEVETGKTEKQMSKFAFQFLGNSLNFNSEPIVRFRLNVEYSGKLEIRIYDIYGRVVKKLVVNVHGAGEYEALWDGRREGGLSLPKGMYFASMEFGNTVQVERVSLSK